jgi:hypothetical protein
MLFLLSAGCSEVSCQPSSPPIGVGSPSRVHVDIAELLLDCIQALVRTLNQKAETIVLSIALKTSLGAVCLKTRHVCLRAFLLDSGAATDKQEDASGYQESARHCLLRVARGTGRTSADELGATSYICARYAPHPTLKASLAGEPISPAPDGDE